MSSRKRNRLTIQYKFLLTAEQKRVFKQAAARDGRSLAEWLRRLAMNAATAGKEEK